MAQGLPVSRVISASVNLAPAAAQFANLNSLLIVGDSDVIDVQTRIRSFATLAEVAAAFGTSAPEYKAAVLFFGQRPQPEQVFIGRWAQSAVAGRLFGATLATGQQALANFTAITNGALKLSIDGAAAVTISSLNLSGAANLNAVAAIITAALTGATCEWNGSQFVIKSASTGATSSIGFPSNPASGTDLKTVLGLVQASGARKVDGIAAETALAAVTALDALATGWYGLMFASTNVVDADHVAVAAHVEAADAPHIYGVTTQNTGALDPAFTTDIASVLKAAGYDRSLVQYSSSSPYAVASLLARSLSVDFAANNTVINLMYQQEPGVTAEVLTSAQADALKAKRCNVFVAYDNATAIIQEGVMSGTAYIDEITGTDWLANAIQTNVYNLLYTSTTKVPQTDAGNHLLANAAEAACIQGVNNGLLAPGVWTAGGFGQLAPGDYLEKGFYIYTPPIASQAQADREARKSVPFQIAAKLAGAVNTVDVLINVNR